MKTIGARGRLIALTTTGALVLAAPAALAHAPVKMRSPAPGKSASNVRTVSIRFGEAVLAGKITVTRNGRTVVAKSSGLHPENKAYLRAIFARSLPAGSYKVNWRVRADDGDSETGSWTFRAR